MTRDGLFHPEMHRHKTAWYSIRPTHAVKFGGSKGGPGASAASWGGSGCRALEDGSGKEGEPKGSGAERAGNIDRTAITVNHLKAHDFGDASSCEVWRLQRGTGASAASWGGSGCHGAKAGCPALENGSGKEGEPKASGAERADNIDHTAITVNHSKARRTRHGGGYWTRSDEFCEYPLLEKLHFHVALEEVRITELLSY